MKIATPHERTRRQRTAERGVALVVVAVFLATLFALTAVGIDVSRLSHTATEVQTVADAAARGGAKALLDQGGTPGVGITRAHLIANKNLVEGDFAPDADVLVDEGFYDFQAKEFQCCTTNSPCCSGGSGGSLGDVTCTDGDAAECATHAAAVLAMPHTTVTNLLAGIFDFMQGGRFTSTAATGKPNNTTRVEKAAMAASSGPANGCQAPEECPDPADWGCYCDHGVAPCLPIAAPSCEFPPGCNGVDCQLPTLQVASNGSDTAGWTGFAGGANANNVRAFLAQGPCDPPGPDAFISPQVIGPEITLNNGLDGAALNQLFGLTQCLAGLGAPPRDQPQGCAVDAGGNIIPGQRGPVFTIAIIDSDSADCTDNFNQSAPIVGFATIEITAVSLGTPRTIAINTLRNVSSTNTQLGGGCFGTDCRVALVK
jgi:hypothetical protein